MIVAGTGEEGLRLAADRRPGALIVDGELPGIDGATVIRRIRLDAALRQLPCLLLTASEDRGAEMRALDAGADAFVRKDEDIPVILARLKAMLRSAGAQTADRGTASLLGPKKILAVDDSETYLQSLADALRADGYEVVLARSGEEALELLAVQPVDCILLDLMMPGIGGRETCRRIKNAPAMRDIPIIMLTALEDREAMIQGLSAGADDYIAKSSDFELVRARVLAQIRRKQFEDEKRRIREQLLRAELEAAEARAAQVVAETRAALVGELEAKNEELESFSYSVAHDLRAPLRSIDGFGLALLEDYGDKLDDDGKQYLNYVRESAQQMAQLIDDMLALSQVTRGEFERAEVDVSAIARGIGAQLQRASPDRRVEFTVAEGLTAEGDARLVAIAFENLLGNAWKFTGKSDPARIEVGVTADGALFVRDNGAGFDMAYKEKLFGVFQRLHSRKEFEGTGIGLATVQRIIRRHGGQIWAEGAVGEGATFFFTLGAGARVAGARRKTRKLPSPRKTRSITMASESIILLVEDNPKDEALTLRALKKANIMNKVVVAHDGAEAVDYLFGTDADGGRNAPPQLILLDLKLPKLDGHEVLKRIRGDARTQPLPVVILTTSVEDRDLLEGYRLGANSYVRKPVDFAEFAQAVVQLGLYWLVLNEQPPAPRHPTGAAA